MNGKYESRLVDELQSKEYRDAFVESHARTGIAYQIRALRTARQWLQGDLGQRAGMGQNVVARLENPDYGKFSISTLLKLASAFDVALLVRFVRFSELLDRTKDLTPEGLNVPSFSDDRALSDGSSVTLPAMDSSTQALLFISMAATTIPARIQETFRRLGPQQPRLQPQSMNYLIMTSKTPVARTIQ